MRVKCHSERIMFLNGNVWYAFGIQQSERVGVYTSYSYLPSRATKNIVPNEFLAPAEHCRLINSAPAFSGKRLFKQHLVITLKFKRVSFDIDCNFWNRGILRALLNNKRAFWICVAGPFLVSVCMSRNWNLAPDLSQKGSDGQNMRVLFWQG